MKPLSFPAQIDYYLDAVTCRDTLVDSLESIIKPYRFGSVLDCSVGTGFGVIDLIRTGYNIVCSDACKDMLRRFSENALIDDVQTSPLKIQWDELGYKLPESFDLVLCRGNSIVYSDMWESHQSVSDLNSVKKAINGIYKAIKNGGCLYIDIPSDKHFNFDDPLVIEHEEKTINCIPVHVKEKITHDEEMMKRKWDVNISIAGDVYQFTKYSHLIQEDVFIDMLKQAGFKNVERVESCKYRGHYCELVAYK
ncbi:class I SAM-dependent methyltransferase [Vibrio sp. TRT 21S02]|uniref:class I SAM-dependent methyltransferase n=1 Tax=Vibrio sp. TRT 21S02 TaxID=3418507 RepID=UPI003CF7FE75